MEDDGYQAVSLGFVNDCEGEKVEVLRNPDGSVLLERLATLTFIEIPASELATLREAIDRAAMTGQEEAPSAFECGHCGDRITLLGGAWTTEDGTTACTDTSAPYVPHKPKEG